MKKMNNKIAKKAMMVMLLVVVMIVATTSGTAKADGNIFNGGKVVEKASVTKKVQKNAWSSTPSADSKALTLGYAVAKIWAFVEADEQATILQTSRLNSYKQLSGESLKFTSATKSQRKALKWAVQTGMLKPLSSEVPYGGIDGKQILTRAELVDLLGKMIDAYYGYRLPFFNTDVKYWADGMWDEMNLTALYKGIVVSASYDTKKFGDADRVRLNMDQPATRQDLTKALKNLKVIVKYNSVKVIKRNLVSYTTSDAISEAEEFIKQLEEKTGAKMHVMKDGDIITISDGFNSIKYMDGTFGPAWSPNLKCSFASGISDESFGWYPAKEYDILSMLLKACVMRAE